MLIRKMLRDMKNLKTQFISIFFMAFIGVFIYAGIGGEWYGLSSEAEDYYHDYNLADVWLYGSDFTKDDVKELKSLENTVDVERRIVLSGIGDYDNNPDLTIYFLESNTISKNMILKGEQYNSKEDGVWVDSLFAKAKGLTLGDQISFTINGYQMEKKILGFIMNPEHVYSSHGNEIIPNHDSFGYLYLSISALPNTVNIPYNQILITTKNKDYNQYEEKVQEILKGRYNVYLSRDNFESYTMFSEEMKQHKAMGGIFPVTFLLIALLTILTTMTRMVSNQRIQIGTLKALGFKKYKIIFHYVSYGFFLSLLGSILGAVIGPKTLPYLFYDSLKTAYTLPKFEPRLLPKVWIMVALMVILCTLINYLACRSILKETPSESLRPKVIHVKNRNRFEKSKLWKKMGFSLQWNIRDIFRSKIRSIMAVIGITGCMGLLVCSFGMWEDLKDLTIWLYEDINQYKSIIHIAEETTTEQIDSMLKDVNGETIMESAIEIKSKDKKKTGQLLVTDQVTLIKFTDVNRKNINIPQDGIMITSKMADSLGVKIGDKIKWHIYGDQKWVTTKIGAINRNPASQGITVSRVEFEELEFQYIPTSIVTDKEVFGQMKGASSIQTIEKEKESYHSITEAMSVLTYVLVVAAIVLAIVVLYNLGVLSYTEKEKELATLKVLGFKTGKVRSLLLTQNIILSFIGIIPGIWFGKILVDVMFHYTGDSMDMMNIISFKNIFISIIITLFMSIMTNLLFSKKLKKIDMVSALKGIE